MGFNLISSLAFLCAVLSAASACISEVPVISDCTTINTPDFRNSFVCSNIIVHGTGTTTVANTAPCSDIDATMSGSLGDVVINCQDVNAVHRISGSNSVGDVVVNGDCTVHIYTGTGKINMNGDSKVYIRFANVNGDVVMGSGNNFLFAQGVTFDDGASNHQINSGDGYNKICLLEGTEAEQIVSTNGGDLITISGSDTIVHQYITLGNLGSVVNVLAGARVEKIRANGLRSHYILVDTAYVQEGIEFFYTPTPMFQGTIKHYVELIGSAIVGDRSSGSGFSGIAHTNNTGIHLKMDGSCGAEPYLTYFHRKTEVDHLCLISGRIDNLGTDYQNSCGSPSDIIILGPHFNLVKSHRNAICAAPDARCFNLLTTLGVEY